MGSASIPVFATAFIAALSAVALWGEKRYGDGYDDKAAEVAPETRERQEQLFRLADRHSMREFELLELRDRNAALLKEFTDAARDDPGAGALRPDADSLRRLHDLFDAAR